jgi:CHAD domain-containing protein
MPAPQLTPALLAEPAERSARVIGRERLDAVRLAWPRLGTDDPEALHDVRVALRRLRSWLSAYRPALDDTVSRKSRRALRKLARATNAARDSEVALLWLEAQTDLPPEAARGYRDLVDRLTAERMQSAHAVEEYLARRLPRAIDRLDGQLGHYWLSVPVEGPVVEPSMAELTAKLLRKHGKALARAVKRARAAHDVPAAHRARIAGKRLRYLLEPLTDDDRAATVVAALTLLQDQLGAYHDAQLLAERILQDVEDIAGADARRRAVAAVDPTMRDDAVPRRQPSRRGQRAGLLEVARRAHHDAARSFASYRRAWNTKALTSTLRDVNALADELQSGPTS